MKIKLLLTFCCLSFATGLLTSNEAQAQRNSLWHRRSAQMTNLAGANRAKNRGDLLFITITEKSDVENTDQRQLRKQNSSASDGTAGYTLAGAVGTTAGNMGFDQASSGDRQFDGNTRFSSEREFTDRFTVKVVDHLPNGNLLVSGTRNVALEGDNRRLILTGVVRAFDVTAANTIPSQLVGELTIRYESDPEESVEKVFLNQGWLGKRLNRWWPH